MRKLLLVAVVAVAGCKKDKPAQPPPSPKAPASTAEQDTLWKLAPDGSIVGVVVSPRAIGMLEGGALAVKKLFATTPELAPLSAKMDAELTKHFGTANVTLADTGLAPGKGAAMFVTADGQSIVIVPVANRDKFIQVTKGTKGADEDKVGKATCKTVQGFYACSDTTDLFARLGKAGMANKLALAGARGDIEFAMVADPNTPIKIDAAGVVQLERGAAVVRGAAKGLPPMFTALLKSSKPAFDASKVAGFATLNVAPLLAMAPIPSEEIIPGVNIADMAKSINGPVSVSLAPGSLVFDMRVPMADTSQAKKLIESCDQFPMLKMMAGATVKNGVCSLSVPQMQTEMDAWIEGNELRVGKKGAPPPKVTLTPSAAASELVAGEWAFAMYGRGSMLGDAQMPAMPPVDAMPDEARMMIRGITLLNELGIGVRGEGDTVRVLATLRTAWSNPDDVVAKIVAVDPIAVMQGKGSQQGKAIADAAPSSPFASDYKAGVGGLMIPTAVVGMLAAVAIPAFMDYTKKSKRSEAHLQLNKLTKNLKVYYMTESKFPAGKVPVSPDKSCCETQGRCDDQAAWKHPIWQELDFMIDEPHMFRYAYDSDGKSFALTAVGDLDCDGDEVRYLVTGTVDAQGNVTTTMTEPAPGSD